MKAFKSIQERDRERERRKNGGVEFQTKKKGKDAVRRLTTEQGETRFFSKFLRCPPNSKLDFQI
jgi:hypothetical protein